MLPHTFGKSFSNSIVIEARKPTVPFNAARPLMLMIGATSGPTPGKPIFEHNPGLAVAA